MKKPKTVVDAESALVEKDAEVKAAKEALNRLEGELSAAYEAVRQAQTEADAGLPQCRIVRILWHSGAEESICRVVIVRRTPGGMLIVRRIGESNSSESKFKWANGTGKYYQADKSSWTRDTRELRDVPAEYLPTCPAA